MFKWGVGKGPGLQATNNDHRNLQIHLSTTAIFEEELNPDILDPISPEAQIVCISGKEKRSEAVYVVV